MTALEEHIENWKKKTTVNKTQTQEWDYNLDASRRPLYDQNGKLNKHKRQQITRANTQWDPLK